MGLLNSVVQILYHSIRMNGLLPVTTSGDRNDGKDVEQLIGLFRTLADPIRLRIVRLLECRPQLAGGEKGGSHGHAPAGSGGLSVGELSRLKFHSPALRQERYFRHKTIVTHSGLIRSDLP